VAAEPGGIVDNHVPSPLRDLIGSSLRRVVPGAAALAVGVVLTTCQLDELMSPGSSEAAVSPETATQLEFTQQPSNVVPGEAIIPAVTVTARDADGNTVSSYTTPIGLALAANPGNAVLTGGAAVTPTNGVATFEGLRLNRSGIGYALAASSNDLAATSAAFNVTDGTTTTTITAATPSPSVTGQTVTLSFTVTSGAGTPTGNVRVGDGVTSCTASVAVGTCTVAFPTTGTHSLTALYGGDATFPTSESTAFAHTVTRASTATTIAGSPAGATVVGESYAVNVAVTVEAPGAGTPTGLVTVSDGVQTCQAAAAEVNCVLTSTTAGTKTLTASYAGDASFTGSTTLSGTAHTVNAAATNATITGTSPNPSQVDGPVTVHYAVAVEGPGAGTPAGTVTVSDGAGTTCTATVAEASCTIAFGDPGTKTLTAAYAGDANFTTSTSAGFSHTVSRAATTTAVSSSANPAAPDRTITFTARVTGSGSTPTGKVRFFIDGVGLGKSSGESLVNGVATIGKKLSAGTYVVTATYLGNTIYEQSTGTLTPDQVVKK
jgi:hypothetical protein